MFVRALSVVAVLACLVTSCGPSAQIRSSGSVAGSRTFQFRNFVELTVESTSATYDWREYNVRDGSAFRVPYSELRLALPSGGVLVTDREVGNGALHIGSALHRGTAFRIRDDGSVEVVAPSAAVVPSAR